MEIKRDLEFLYELGCIRFIQRSWRQFLNADYQNLAEHIFRTTWISIILAKREGVQDISKVIKIALTHDLEESRTGDVNYLSRQFVKFLMFWLNSISSVSAKYSKGMLSV